MKIPRFPCHIEELSISCFGCCGNKFSPKEEIYEDIRLNTEELKVLGKVFDSNKLKLFRDRFDGDNALSMAGLCYNYVDLGGCSGCPLHPKVNELGIELQIKNKDDLRVGHCDINEECHTFKAWKKMSNDEKLEFIQWVKENNYDSYSYSVENGNETLFTKYSKK